jgi:hypothetical protein
MGFGLALRLGVLGFMTIRGTGFMLRMVVNILFVGAGGV